MRLLPILQIETQNNLTLSYFHQLASCINNATTLAYINILTINSVQKHSCQQPEQDSQTKQQGEMWQG